MGIDVDYWLLVRSDAPFTPPDSVPEFIESPGDEAAYIFSRVRAAESPRDRVAAAYVKNGNPEDVAGWLGPTAEHVVRGDDDRLLLFSTMDGQWAATAWARTEGRLERRTTYLEWEQVPETFVPEEPAVALVLLDSPHDEGPVDVRLAKALDGALRDGIRRCLGGEGVFLWTRPEPGVRGIAVAVHKYCVASGGGTVLLVYQTAIEGCFAWVCGGETEWPRHVRMPCSLANAPGDLRR